MLVWQWENAGQMSWRRQRRGQLQILKGEWEKNAACHEQPVILLRG
jgi:hypothetical protein